MAGYYHYYISIWRRRPRFGLYPEDIQAAFLWTVAFSTTALWLIQPHEWLRKQFTSKPEDGSTT